jgi:hypothetical protein
MNAPEKRHRKMGEAKATRVPTIGRIVHFKSADGPQPAIVVKVWSPVTVNLKVFPDANDLCRYETSVSQGKALRNWDWPEQV